MRTFTIISHGETTTELDADRMAIDNGIVSFWETIGTSEQLVGLSRDWTVISSNAQDEGNEDKDLPEMPDPFAAFDAVPADRVVVNPDVIGPRQPAITQPVIDELKKNGGAFVAALETSEPDAPGVSNDPIPEPEPALEDVADATPPENPPTSESTGTDDLPAEEGGSSSPFEMDELALKIGKAFADNRKKPILEEIVQMWEQEGIPSSLTAQTLDQRRRTWEFLVEKGAAT